jgi:hypothetical protein
MATELVMLAIARQLVRARRRPVIINHYHQPVVSIVWPLYAAHYHLN